MKNVFKLIIIFLLASLTVHAQKGDVYGVVVDSVSGDPLPGANIILEGTSIGAAAELTGRYKIQGIPEGTYLVKVRYVGYKEITDSLEVFPGLTTMANFQLNPDMIETLEVTVTAQAQGQVAAINQQLSSNTIKNVVSSDRMEEIPDANIGESLGRLPGVSIIRSGGEADKVTIRGLSPRFNSVSVEGVQMTSTNERNRSVSLASISSNTLAGVEVSKALTPDMDGNAIGGAINLKMKEAKEDFHVDVLAQGGYNEHDDKFNNYKFTTVLSNRILDGNLGFVLSLNAEQVNRGKDELRGSWSKEFEKSFPLNGNWLDLKDQQDLRKRLGATLVLDYVLPFGLLKLSNFASRLDREIAIRKIRYPKQGRVIYNIRDIPEAVTDQMVNSLFGEFNIFHSTLDVQFSHALSNVDSRSNDWSFAQDNAISEDAITPDGFIDARTLDQFASIFPNETYLNGLSKDKRDTKERELTTSFNWRIPFSNFTDLIGGYLKLGGKYSHRTREQDIDSRESPIWDEHRFLHDVFRDEIPDVTSSGGPNFNVMMGDFMDPDFKVDNFLGGNYLLPAMPRMDVLQRMSNIAEREIADRGLEWDWNTRSSVVDDYEGSEDLKAGYVMAEFNLFNNALMILPGIRYEHSKHEYTAAQYAYSEDDFHSPDLVQDTTESGTNEFWLPMVHLKFSPTDWLDIRIAQTKTLTRPNFRDITPLRIINLQGTKQADGGNPDLKPASSWNTDASISIYTNYTGLFTFSGFYKEIRDLIWTTSFYIPKGEAEVLGLPDHFDGVFFDVPTNNRFNAIVRGFEVDWQAAFWYLPQPFNGLVFNINYSYIFSETKYPDTFSRRIPGTRPPQFARIDTFSVAGLEDQPDNILNLSFGYDFAGFSGRISYLRQARTLTNRSKQEILNVFTEDYERWDITLKQDLPWEGLQVFFDINNVTDSPDKRFQLSEIYPTFHEYYGRSFTLRLRYVY